MDGEDDVVRRMETCVDDVRSGGVVRRMETCVDDALCSICQIFAFFVTAVLSLESRRDVLAKRCARAFAHAETSTSF